MDERLATVTQPDASPAPSREEELARQVIELARGLVISDNHFLAAATGLLELRATELARPLATDGEALLFDARRLLAAYAARGEAPSRDYVHTLVHCLLLHPFVDASVEARSWDLAADVVAEGLVAELLGPREAPRGPRIEAVLKQLEGDFGGPVTTERLYRALRDGAYADARGQWDELFASDDHAPWHVDAQDAGAARPQQGASASPQAGGKASQGGDGQPSQAREAAMEQARDSSRPGAGDSDFANGSADEGDGGDTDMLAPSTRQAESRTRIPQENPRARQQWEQAAKSLRVDLETLSRMRGERLGGLMRELEVTGHEHIDYRDFLRQFAVRGEHLRVSDDEFDYVLYTYGLELYGDMPLIEPLEYKDERRVRDFAIVIDTSSSVTGKVVQQFVDTTFDVLTSEASFFEKVNIHIIQCDTRVQSDVKLTSLADLDRWRRNIRLYGFGGTDFRPAFAYVDELLAAGEFDDLSGLLYFTDGWGTYPTRMPPYPTAFVFYDEDHRPDLVPAWAIQVVLHPGQYESLSVY